MHFSPSASFCTQLCITMQAEIPTFWADKDPLDSNTTILNWIQHCQDSDLIEEITEEMLEKLIANTDQGTYGAIRKNSCMYIV